jgi:hypothetical protein
MVLTTEPRTNKRVSDAIVHRAEQRFGKTGVVGMTGVGAYDTFLAMQLNRARHKFSGEGPRLSRFPDRRGFRFFRNRPRRRRRVMGSRGMGAVYATKPTFSRCRHA